MNFQLAAESLNNSFTLQEKTLAKAFSESLHYDQEHGGTVYLRRPCLRLDESLQIAEDEVKSKGKSSFRRLVLYCDTLQLSEELVLGNADPKKPFELRVFARKVVSQGSPSQALHMKFSGDSQLEIFTYALEPGFTAQFGFSDGSTRSLPLTIDQNKWGIQVGWTGEEFVVEQHDPDMLDMSTANYLDRLNEDGTLKDGRYINDNLPRLVAYEFLVAASVIHSDRKLALDILNWVCNLSASEASAALNIQACSLRNNLVLSEEQTLLNVPSINIYSSKRVLKSRLAAAKAFEDAFQSFVGQERFSLSMIGQTTNLLARSEDAMSEYNFLEDLAQKGYGAAVKANDSARNRYNDNEKTLESLKGDFEKGLENYCKEKKEEAAKGVFWACVGAVGAVAATVATGGLAAPLVPLAAGSAVSAGVTIANIIKTIQAVHKAINEILKKLQPVLKKLKELAAAIDKVVAALAQSKTLKDKTALQRPDMSLDIFNATALWDMFDLQVTEIEKAISDIKFGAKGKYFNALRTLVINGKTYLQTQENLCQRGNELSLVLLKTKLQHKEKSRLQSTLNVEEQQGAVIDILKRAMFDRLLTIRSLIFLDFQTHSDAYRFHALTDIPPVQLSPVKPVVDYLDDAARLQGSIAAFGAKVMVQRRKFTITTCGDAGDAEGLRRQLQKDGSVRLRLDPTNSAFQGFCRVRVAKARCYLEGLDTVASDTLSSLRLLLRTSGRFYDINLPNVYGTKEESGPGYRAFVGDPRTILFEYQPTDSSIICDGEYGQELDYTKQSPLTDWEVAIARGGLSIDDLKLDGLTGLRMELWCDVTLSDV
ncbi:hypothetical protein HD806DRAFT_509714 [Xylariaceae sp. AK1471]|nr:hypothetical protein HD806DRAFT_509714 [Xylariaceae sp. AK1471]